MLDEKLRLRLKVRGYTMAGDLVHLSGESKTEEIRSSEQSILLTIMTADYGGTFALADMRLHRFRKNPIVLFNHDYEGLPVGRSLWERVRLDQNDYRAFTAKAQFHRDTELSREVFELLKGGASARWLMAAIPTEWSWNDGHLQIRTWDLLEYSCWFERNVDLGGVSAPSLLRVRAARA